MDEVSPPPPFLGRRPERVAYLKKLTGRKKPGAPFIHFRGPPEIGKTALARQIPAWTASISEVSHRAIVLDGIYTYEPLNQLIGIRNNLRLRLPKLNTDRFDFAVALLMSLYPDSHPGISLEASKFRIGALLQAAADEGAKDGGKQLSRELVLALGAGAGSSVIAGGANAFFDLVEKLVLEVGVGVGATFTYLVTRYALIGALAKAKKQKLMSLSPALRRAVGQGKRPELDDLKAALPRLLAECLNDYSGKIDKTAIFCFTIDPADELAATETAFIGPRLAKQLYHFFSLTESAVVATTAKRGCRDILLHAGRAAKSFHTSEAELTCLPLKDVVDDLAAITKRPNADLTRALKPLCAADGTVAPADIARWWNEQTHAMAEV